MAAIKEPFSQRSRSEGSRAEHSMTLDYVTSINVIAIFNSMRNGHHLVWWSGLVSLKILFMAPLASETIFISTTGVCTATSGWADCFPTLSIFPPAARALQGILAFVTIMTLALAIALWRRRNCVFAIRLPLLAWQHCSNISL